MHPVRQKIKGSTALGARHSSSHCSSLWQTGRLPGGGGVGAGLQQGAWGTLSLSGLFSEKVCGEQKGCGGSREIHDRDTVRLCHGTWTRKGREGWQPWLFC